MTNKQQRIVFLLMGVNVLVFVVIFLLVGSNQRHAADDFHYLIKTQELGIWDSTVYYFNNWNTRWASTMVRSGLLYFGISLFVVNICSLILGLVSIKTFISTIISPTRIPFTSKQQWIVAAYLLMAVFYATFGKADSWFWLSAAPSYLWGCFAALLGGSLLLKESKSVLRYLAIVGLFIYVGGSSESVALATIISLCYLGFISHKRKLQIDINRKALHLATVCCFISFGICLIGPGLDVRKEFLPQYPLSDKLVVGFWNYFKFNFKEIPLLLPLVILIVSPFGFFGRKHLQFQLISIKEVFWENKRIWGLADLTIAILAFSLAMIMGEMGPTRTWIPITFIVITISVFIAYQLGTWIYIKSNGKLIYLVVGAQILLFSFQVGMGYHQISKTNQYAMAVDERMKLIPSFMVDKSMIHRLEPLPESAWLFSSEITSDTTHFTNNHLELFFYNKYNLALKDSITSVSE
jgi:hypothetical protein